MCDAEHPRLTVVGVPQGPQRTCLSPLRILSIAEAPDSASDVELGHLQSCDFCTRAVYVACKYADDLGETGALRTRAAQPWWCSRWSAVVCVAVVIGVPLLTPAVRHLIGLGVKRQAEQASGASRDMGPFLPSPVADAGDGARRSEELLSDAPGEKPVSAIAAVQQTRIYEIRPGDTLEAIARRETGSVRGVEAIMALNKAVIRNADIIKPGTVIQLPPVVEIDSRQSVGAIR